jgi:hypothetical protein
MAERARFIARLKGDGMSDLFRELRISQKTDYKLFSPSREGRSRRLWAVQPAAAPALFAPPG